RRGRARSVPWRRSRLVPEQQNFQCWHCDLLLTNRPFFEEVKTMKIASNNRLLVGTAVLTLITAGLYGCKDFLANNAVPQGTLDEGTLSNKVGVEGTLIGAYRTLDCTNNTGAWGCAASNWVWGSVA